MAADDSVRGWVPRRRGQPRLVQRQQWTCGAKWRLFPKCFWAWRQWPVLESATGNGTPDWNMGPTSKASPSDKFHDLPRRCAEALSRYGHHMRRGRFPQTRQMTRGGSHLLRMRGAEKQAFRFTEKAYQQVKSKKKAPAAGNVDIHSRLCNCGGGGQEQRVSVWRGSRRWTLRREDGYCYPETGLRKQTKSNSYRRLGLAVVDVRMADVHKASDSHRPRLGWNSGELGQPSRLWEP